MEIRQIEYTAELFLKMLRNHPELCPHDWEFWCSYPNIQDGKSGKTYEYRCSICGKEEIEFKENEK